ncbi:MAG: GGDEF domain-containing protein [Clostridiales bacterium]|nr:GGDEF domain-containing protein [Clostridiales bacterium]
MNNRIAIFANGFSNEFVEHIVTGLWKKAKEDCVDLFAFVTYCSPGDHELQNKCQLNIFHLPDPKEFDGAIMLTNTYNFPDEQERVCARFQRAGVPMLSLEVDVPNMSCIKSENYKGVRDLANHLIEHHNVKKILFVNGVKENVENATRRQALIDALEEHGLKLFDEFYCDFGFYTAYRAMKKYADEGKEIPDAIVCANDHMALGINSALTELGYSVPEDVLLTGFDMTKDGQHTFPILSTVSRDWDKFGERAYDKLKYQISHPDERFTEEYSSVFIPSESCGCPATKEAIKNRYNAIRNVYFDNLQKEIMDVFFMGLQVPLSFAVKKEDFYEKGMMSTYDVPLLGPDYCLCTEPAFFELDDDQYPDRIRGYSSHMDILFELRDRKRMPLRHFDSKQLYPDYAHVDGQSDLYIFAPLNYLGFIIGYIAIKNSPALLYNLSLSGFIKNMNAQLFSMRRHIFSDRTNKELKKIYMTDGLTGLYNRMGCEKVLYDFISSRKEHDQKSILVFADIDRMKTINDLYGHLNGDLAIKATAEAFRKYSPEDWLFGRYGGDEFIAVGPCPDEDTIEQLIRQISQSMSSEFATLNLSFILHASIGYTIIEPGDDASIEDYIDRADKYMYSEKEKYHEFIDSISGQKGSDN